MIVMMDTPQPLDVCAQELGATVEQLFSPQTYRLPQYPERRFCIDNGAFGNFDGPLFLRLVKRHLPQRDLCRFVAVPDMVADAQRTAELFDFWAPRIAEIGAELPGQWPLAYVAQDGQAQVRIPWDRCSALFLGGTDDWKMSKEAARCLKAAKMMGKWVHVGRVNTPGRFEYFEEQRTDSCDGNGLAQYTHMRKAIWDAYNQPKLDLTAA